MTDEASTDGPPLRLALLGLGLIGGSVGLAARERLGARVVGFDPDPHVRERALALGVVDETVDDPARFGPADVALVAAPVGALAARVAEACVHVAGAVVTDVGSTKRALVEAELGDRYIGGHPLAGAEVAGVEHARADLFAGATWYLTPRPQSEGILLERLHRFVTGLGAVPTVIGHEEHDRLMAAFSHVPHVVANAMVTAATRALGDEAIPVVGPSFRDATRVAGANPPLWAGIYTANRDAVLDGLDATIDLLREARALLASGDAGALEGWQATAGEQRRALLDVGMAGGPLREVRVVVPNRPGVIADLALTLSRAGINIHDMSLSPQPDFRSGEVALWVAEGHADRARELVEQVIA
ncbi:MAG TPA: prephenate dehydrogenase/arogenate dehydrogenase family protein [Baekduia sp.]|uniref:prephenate dehydrogenase/arogenate dehydrogenase family protein n=1 Tax=Baekduia sp. TaxID=2600305 RepID=UPI002BA5C274|nr:prephenate dehydrogenase/arogenate dehydrogenase family protein [Baekduia sp.]HMJ35677.1 prephenate dehydrogenase/arogenate dehydrogenase family protein [Baekduia sp.]